MFIMIVVSLVLSAYSMYVSYKNQQKASPLLAEDFEATTAKESETIPVIFGTCWLGQNVVWYGEVSSTAIKSKSGKK